MRSRIGSQIRGDAPVSNHVIELFGAGPRFRLHDSGRILVRVVLMPGICRIRSPKGGTRLSSQNSKCEFCL